MLNKLSSLPLNRRATAFLGVLAMGLVFSSGASVSAQTVSAPPNVATLAGSAGIGQYAAGTGSAARFYAPTGLVLDASGNLIVADAANNLFRKVSAAGLVTVLVGSPVDSNTNPINVGSTDGAGSAAKFHLGDPVNPPVVGSFTLGIDGSGNIYFADTQNDTIRKITPAGVVVTIAGSPGSQGSADGSGSNAQFFVPGGVAADSAGNVYVADSANDTIRKITPDGTVTTIAGVARAYGNTDGTGTAARFTNPSGIAIDAIGNLYVTDTANHTIRKISPGGVVTTLAGKAGIAGTADGSGTAARFHSPSGIAVDASGNLYVADTENHAIRKVSPSGTVTTVAGTIGTSGIADGTGTAAQFNEPYGVAIDSSGTLYIADTSNDTIRRGVPISTSATLQITEIPPVQVQTTTGNNVSLKIVANGSPAPTYQWSKDGAAISGATNATLALNSVTPATAGSYSVVVTSGVLTYTSSATNLQVFAVGTPVPSVTLIAQAADRSVSAGQTTSFTVEATSAQPLTYQWALNGQSIPGATASTYTIGSAQSSNSGSYTVTVSDGISSVTSSSANLLVNGASNNVAPSISAQPVSQTQTAGGTVTFAVTASGTPTPTYQWQKNGTNLSNGGNVSGATTSSLTISNITASDAASYTVIVSNIVSSVVSSAATLTIGTPPAGPTAWLSNLSVRTTLQAGQDPLTVGLTVRGGSKSILVRGAGPALTAIGVSGAMADPKLVLFPAGSTTSILSNDDWDSSLSPLFDQVGAFGFPPGSKDAAFVQTLTNGYTIQAPETGPGLVLVEAYDMDPTNTSARLVNISARNVVGTGDNILIEGFAIRGSGTEKLLIRAVGPTLGQAPFNIGGVLADPMLQVYDGNTVIAQNDNWDSSLTTTFDQVGAFHLTSPKDAALIVSLQGGPAGKIYTVQVKGADGGTGQAIVEIYELPSQ